MVIHNFLRVFLLLVSDNGTLRPKHVLVWKWKTCNHCFDWEFIDWFPNKCYNAMSKIQI